jgi:hypothetical protein
MKVAEITERSTTSRIQQTEPWTSEYIGAVKRKEEIVASVVFVGWSWV